MHYPWWYVPHLTSPMLIAAISVLHVLVSHYAVGGGLFLAVEVGHAYRTGNRDYLDYLRRHARFFILLTVVFGAISGVGIWWTIGLASPLATEVLIRTFVFGWATEWAFFVVEVISAFIFYYFWTRLAARTHVAIGWIYALAAWISLVLITGITAFMLNPGDWAISEPGLRDFWTKFFNPQFIPQTIARTGGALLLSSLYVYLHASLTLSDPGLRDMIAARSARPALLGAAAIIAGGLGWFYFLPPSAMASLGSAAALTFLFALVFALTGAVFILLYLGPIRNPGWLSPGFALSLCLFGIAAFSASEFLREAVRKPFVIYNVVLSNQILPEQTAELRNTGYLNGGICTKAHVKVNYPQTIVGDRVDGDKLLALEPADRAALGRVLFQYHCNDCHAAEVGYSAVGPLLKGRRRELIRSLLDDLETVYFMPPWCGTPQEAELLCDYLMSINPPRPPGMRLGIDVPPSPGTDAKRWSGRGAGGEGMVSDLPSPTGRGAGGEGMALIAPAPAALPAPYAFVQFFKWLGFTLHAVPMNLWYAGLLVALGLHLGDNPHARRFAARLIAQMPVIVALGVNFGIVPLLFIQLAYYRVFYPATIFVAWSWLAIIALLIPAYYGVYAYAWGLSNHPREMARWRWAAGWAAAVFFLAIGFLFSHGLSLMDHVERWPALWQDNQLAGAALGTAANLADPTLWPRWLLMFGLALCTTAVWLLVDVFWFNGRESDDYRRWALGFARKLYTIGMIWAAAAGAWYVFGTWSDGLRGYMFEWPRGALTVLTAVATGGPWLVIAAAGRQLPGKTAAALAALGQLGVLGINALSRQIVQNANLRLGGHFDPSAQPTDVQWGPLWMFLIVFLLALTAIAWMLAKTIGSHRRSGTA